ncbi:hypothetical protein, partial [Corynebacterium bovis]|uniref:hypothetical protein n=1 Tax=Corynebacterium bovis TaxID=36808 RepID=UPI0021AB8BBD
MSKAKDTAWATRSTGVSVAEPEGDDAAPRVRSRTASTAGAKIGAELGSLPGGLIGALIGAVIGWLRSLQIHIDPPVAGLHADA